jgi:hypothetical protein
MARGYTTQLRERLDKTLVERRDGRSRLDVRLGIQEEFNRMVQQARITKTKKIRTRHAESWEPQAV